MEKWRYYHMDLDTIKSVKRCVKSLAFTAGMLKGALAEGWKTKKYD